jgi:hypothetical protein
MTEFPDDMTLCEARDLLRTKVYEGHRCPLCTQFAKVYRRKVSATMSLMAIRMWHKGRDGFVYLPDLRDGNKGMDQTVMQYFALIEEERASRPDGGRVGSWRLTPLGVGFVLKQRRVSKYAVVYNGRRLGFDGPPISIIDALGTRFSYAELMRGV